MTLTGTAHTYDEKTTKRTEKCLIKWLSSNRMQWTQLKSKNQSRRYPNALIIVKEISVSTKTVNKDQGPPFL